MPPLEPENFNCISSNWQDLNCTWSEPDNYLSTNYTLFFQQRGRAGGATE